MGTVIEGFAFNDFCQRCQKVIQHRVELDSKELFGVCTSCGERRVMTEANQVYYRNTDLWVTRFRIGNIQNVVAGKLLDTIRNIK